MKVRLSQQEGNFFIKVGDGGEGTGNEEQGTRKKEDGNLGAWGDRGEATTNSEFQRSKFYAIRAN
ncbi:MAG: hypothetical protein QNJ72_08000 [Pleurocapsa sp. MO_226.B13]|nr:hypothetical protein [Pleurocapsa sp. MO_226.B13]